jgi:integrase
MARKKKQIKAKEPVRLRFKDLANGNQSIYLDIYRNGKRSYEFLKLYLIPESIPGAKLMNENTLTAADAIKDQRKLSLLSDESGIPNSQTLSKMLLSDWMRQCAEYKRKIGSKSSCTILEQAAKRLIDYKGDTITMKEVDKDFCIGFIDSLKHAETKCFMRGKHKGEGTGTKKKVASDDKTEVTPLKLSTAKVYVAAFNYALTRAVKKDIILFNPMTKLEADERIKVPGSLVAYLTPGEVRALVATPCKNEWVKYAYLFSCNCGGLRISDVEGLTWGDIEQDGTRYRARIVVEKTERALYPFISKDAIKWLPERNGAKDTDKVFRLPCRITIGRVLEKWATSAGIKKHVTFHTSRHTFGTSLKSKGIALDVIQKAMGHKDIKTTQIYAEVEDKAIEEAVNSMAGLFDVEPVEVDAVK